ncbi:CopD family protein [Aureimonas frigidaquae]|uniref:CopD family protein n=1 Tax=Aureimonas frigidaquae TaxID=424757 RepID=UPI0007806879|nr:CopD family protein [Aureimonas frigidaquae]
MMVVWLKIGHIIALSIWCAGLLAMPFMLSRREAGLVGEPLYERQKVTRFVFISLVSPAAFIAIGTGTALIFAMETFTAWFAIKLLFVGLLAKLHIRMGTAVVEVFKEGEHFPLWKMLTTASVGVVLVVGILVIVLWKPSLAALSPPDHIMQPGGLADLLGFYRSSSPTSMPTP